MTQVLVRYKVKPEHTAENEQLVRAVYDELQRTEPSGFHYATFQLDDGVTFVHLSSTDSDDGQNPLSEVEAFKRFQDNIGDRCDEPPVVTRLREIGSYHLFGGQAGRDQACARRGQVPGAGHAVPCRRAGSGISHPRRRRPRRVHPSRECRPRPSPGPGNTA